jgi:hypothetical protein
MTSDDPAAAVDVKRSAAAPAKRSSTRRGGGPAHADGAGQALGGFVGPALKGEGGWRIVRLEIACCAGDATAMRLFRVADRCVHGPGPGPAFASLPRR